MLSTDSPINGDVFRAIRTCWPLSDAIYPVEMESALVNQCARREREVCAKAMNLKYLQK